MKCSREENITRYQQEGLVPFVSKWSHFNPTLQNTDDKNFLYILVDAVYAMAHSLHNLVLDVCCNNSKYFHSKEEALKVHNLLRFAFWSVKGTAAYSSKYLNFNIHQCVVHGKSF